MANQRISLCFLRTCARPRLGRAAAAAGVVRAPPSASTVPTAARLTSPLPRARPRAMSTSARLSNSPQPADNPGFKSILDQPTVFVRAGRKHGPGLIVLALIPITAFCLGTWQVYRLRWKTDLIAKAEDRIYREPLPLPPRIDPDVVAADFDFRRVYAAGRFRHDQEMRVGPRIMDGEPGYIVYTPLERDPVGEGGAGSADKSTTILVNRGWIPKAMGDQRKRTGADALPEGEVRVEGMLRKPWRKNMFTPNNRPDLAEFYFPDIYEMAGLVGAQPVMVEQSMAPNVVQVYDYKTRGVPIGRPAEVNIRNSHAQYIFTWYALSLATSVMFYMVVKKPRSAIARRSDRWS